jgi:transcriptional activator CaiF
MRLITTSHNRFLIRKNGVNMSEQYVGKPLYLLIADWMMAEDRWVTAREISIQFDIEHCKAINTLSYILSDVGEITCEVKMIPNKLAGRGCQCQRLVRVINIDPQLYTRLSQSTREKIAGVRKTPHLSVVPPAGLNCEQKWKMMLSKSMRR